METSGTRSPVFVNELLPVRIWEGEEIFLNAVVSGNPQPTEVVWKHDGAVILPESSDTLVYYTPGTGSCELTISEAFPEDAGTYSVEAANKFGVAVTQTEVVVLKEDAPEVKEYTIEEAETAPVEHVVQEVSEHDVDEMSIYTLDGFDDKEIAPSMAIVLDVLIPHDATSIDEFSIETEDVAKTLSTPSIVDLLTTEVAPTDATVDEAITIDETTSKPDKGVSIMVKTDVELTESKGSEIHPAKPTETVQEDAALYPASKSIDTVLPLMESANDQIEEELQKPVEQTVSKPI